MEITTTILTIENNYGKCSIEANKTDMSLGDLMEDLIVPLLLAAGYGQGTIDSYIDTE